MLLPLCRRPFLHSRRRPLHFLLHGHSRRFFFPDFISKSNDPPSAAAANSSVNNNKVIGYDHHVHVHVREEEVNNNNKMIESKIASLRPRMHLQNHVQSLLNAGDLDAARIAITDSFPILPLVDTCNLVMDAMYHAKRYDDAKALFHRFFFAAAGLQSNSNLLRPDFQSYENFLLSHCHSSEDVDNAFKIYRYLFDKTNFYLSSSDTYSQLIQALLDADRITDAAFTFWEIPKRWEHDRTSIYNDIIWRLLKSRNFNKAKQLFDELEPLQTRGIEYRVIPSCLVILTPSILDRFFETPLVKELEKVIEDEAVRVDAINKMVNKCFEDGKFNDAMDVFNGSCKEEGFRMVLSGFNNIIEKLSELHMMAEAEDYYRQLWTSSFSSPDVHTYIPMIDAYISLDMVDNVLDKFVTMVNLKLATNTSRCYTNKCFGYLIDRGRALDCAPILSKMIRNGMEVDATTCNTVIHGLVNQGHIDSTVYDVLCDMKEFQCNIAGISNTDDSCSTMSTTVDDDLDTDVGLIPPMDGELERYGLKGWGRNDEGIIDVELTIAALRHKFQLDHRVKTLIRAGDLDAASQMSISAAEHSVMPFADTCNEIMDAMYRAKRYNDVNVMFDYFFELKPYKSKALHKSKVQVVVDPDAKSCNIDILSRCECECTVTDDLIDKCLDVREYTNLALSLDTYLCVIRMFPGTKADELLYEIMRKWGKKHPWVYSLVVLKVLNFGLPDEAKKIFHELKKWRCPDFAFTGVVDTNFLNSFPRYPLEKIAGSDAINTLVNERFKAGKVKEAIDAFNSFTKGRELEDSFTNGREFEDKHVRMDLGGYNNMIARLCEVRMMDEAEDYYQRLWKSSCEIPDVNTYIPLIDAYLDLAQTDNALDKFMAMLNLELVASDSIPTTRLFDHLIRNDRHSDCARMLSKMLRKGMRVGATLCTVTFRDLFNEGRFHETFNLLCDIKEFEDNINWDDGYKKGSHVWYPPYKIQDWV